MKEHEGTKQSKNTPNISRYNFVSLFSKMTDFCLSESWFDPSCMTPICLVLFRRDLKILEYENARTQAVDSTAVLAKTNAKWMKPVFIYASERVADINHTKIHIFMVDARVKWALYHRACDIAKYLSSESKPRVNTEVVHDIK